MLAAISLAVTGGCTTGSHSTIDSAKPGADQPADVTGYIPGTVYVYASGRWDRVESVSGSSVRWANHRGYPSTTVRDFTFRPVDWKSATHEGTREYQPAEFLFSSKPSSLWPLKVGNRSGYYELNRWHPLDQPYRTYKAYWSCEVEEKAKVTVPAGTFDTFKVVCARFSGRASSAPAYAREYRTWYYAPAIHHWVAYERDYRGEERRTSRKRLSSVVPSLEREGITAEEKEAIETFYQATLAGTADGKTAIWRSGSSSLTVTMQPHQTFQHKESATCRQYSQHLVVEGREENYYGVACQLPGKGWEVPMR
jgi:surface antigen